MALVPLILHVEESPRGPRGRWQATRAGVITGVVCFGILLYWMATALLRYSSLAIPAYMGAVLVLAGLIGAFAWALHLTRERLRLPLPVAVAIFWTAVEFSRAHLGDLAFPWLGLGTALAPIPTLAAAADLVGAHGLTLWIAAINGAAASILIRYRSGRSTARQLAALLGVLAVPAAYGVARESTLETRPAARVAIVQPNIPEEVKLSPLGLDSSLTALNRLTRTLEGAELERTPVDLVVWPEVALPADLLASDRLQAAVQELSDRVRAPILVGAYGVDHHPAGAEAHNSAFLVAPRGSDEPGGGGGVAPGAGHPAPVARYDKRRLVPFVERVPFVGPRTLAPARLDDAAGARFGDLHGGREGSLFPTPTGSRFGTLICFESIFAPLARSYRVDGADFLVSITNDAWFGRDTPVGRTTALWQHPAHLVLRAIETRTGVARAANTGISMTIDPLGRTHHHTPLFQPAIVTATIHTTDATTLFVRWGDWLATLAALGALALVLYALHRRE